MILKGHEENRGKGNASTLQSGCFRQIKNLDYYEDDDVLDYS
jgi:hypothetical protein